MKLYSLALLLATATVAQTPTQPVCSVGATCKMVNGKVVVIAQTPAPKPVPQTRPPTVVDIHVDLNVPGSVYVNSQTGRVVKLSDEEYARRQKLIQALADEDKKIAAAHGVDTTGCVPHGDTFCTKGGDLFHGGQIVPAWFPDRYEFRGQWLLINVPPSAKGPR